MGWTHALWWCQEMRQRWVEAAGLSPDRRLADKHAAPALDGPEAMAHLQYVDNFAAMSPDPQVVSNAVTRVRDYLVSLGLAVHEVEICTTISQLLGWRLDGEAGLVSPVPRRAWRLRLAISHVLQTQRASSRAIEMIVGH
eukprot:2491442-Lingulodinium_polyedra.AAC.1